ncbi:MAG: glycosyltransferase family 2 protein [Ruegeria sp.]
MAVDCDDKTHKELRQLRYQIKKLKYQNARYQQQIDAATCASDDAKQQLDDARQLLDLHYVVKNKPLTLAYFPLLTLLLPVTLPMTIYRYLIKRKQRRKEKRAKKNKLSAKQRNLEKQSGKAHSIVLNAFWKLKEDREQEAFELLETRRSEIPDEIIPLFRSAAASDDQTWLDNFNLFLSSLDKPIAVLEASEQPRFNRIRFSPVKAVTDGPKVSVIMPTFNCEDTVRYAVDSILNQSWQNLELIAVDDCSQDSTYEILCQIAETDSRLVVLRQTVNGGPYVAKNRALATAIGEYITGHDADDIALPDRIAVQMQPILDDPDCQASIGYMTRLDTDARFSWPTKVGSYSFNGACRIASISLLIQKEVMEFDLGYWDTVRFGADSELIARAGELLGERLVKLETLTMLCLDDASGLTGHVQHGISVETGMSPSRIEYRDAWRAWHQNTMPEDRFLPFPHHGADRFFDQPENMKVSDDVIKSLKEYT